ncbi:MAG TPA: hypothetical protein VGB03_04660 [Acidimicrobiales bacterium]
MGKAVKFAVLGGLAGAGVAGYRALKQDETIEVVARRAATIGGEVAAAGLAVGMVLDRRTRRKARAAAAIAMAKRGKFAAAAIAAKPVVEHAMERAMHAAEVAKPKVEHAAELAKPKVEKAAKAAKAKATEAAEVAKPHMVEFGDKMTEKLSSLRDDKPVLVSIR